MAIANNNNFYSKSCNSKETENVVIYDNVRGETYKLTITANIENAIIKLNGIKQSVGWYAAGSQVKYEVSADGYETQTGTIEILPEDNVKEITLVQPPTQLELNPAETEFDFAKDETKEIKVITNASDYLVESKNTDKATVEKKEGGFIIRAITGGEATIEIKAQAEKCAETIKTLTVNITVETTLTLNPETVSVEKGSMAEVEVQTNASDYQAESKDISKATVQKNENIIQIAGVEVSTGVIIEVKATAEGGEEVIKNIIVDITEPITEETEETQDNQEEAI